MKPSSEMPPCWKKDFPIRQSAEPQASRREFAKFLGLASLATLFGTGLAAGRRLLLSAKTQPAAAIAVAKIDDLHAGGYHLFRYPTQDDPGILLRLGPDKFVAFAQRCTHLSCPVHFQARENQLVCPCHEGFFSAEDGRVLAGPPRRPLKRYEVKIRERRIWVRPVEPEDTVAEMEDAKIG